MSYTVNKSNGDIAAVVNEYEKEIIAGLNIVGYGYANFGEDIAENFVKVVENFRGNNPPYNYTRGQLWLDTNSSRGVVPILRVAVGNATNLDTVNYSQSYVAEDWAPLFAIDAANGRAGLLYNQVPAYPDLNPVANTLIVRGSNGKIPRTSLPDDVAAGEAQHAIRADLADLANLARQLAPGSKINGIAYNGAYDIALSTADVSELNNLYYTDGRARNAISGAGKIIYNKTTGVISYNDSIAMYIRPNVCRNGGFERGKEGWTGNIDNLNIEDNRWGRCLAITNPIASGGIYSAPFPCQPDEFYTIAANMALVGGGGACYVDIMFYDVNDNLVGDGGEKVRSASFDFADNAADRDASASQWKAPSNTVFGRARFVWNNVAPGSYLGVRQIKVERGQLPWTAYTAEGTVSDIYASVVKEQVARVSADSAFAQDLTQVTARVGVNESKITQVATAQSNLEQTTAQTLQQLTSTSGANTASVNQLAGTLATVQGRTKAYWNVNLSAGLGAEAFISANAERADGSISSDISLGARQINILNPVDGVYKPALRVEGGDVQIFGKLQADSITAREIRGQTIIADNLQDGAFSFRNEVTNQSGGSILVGAPAGQFDAGPAIYQGEFQVAVEYTVTLAHRARVILHGNCNQTYSGAVGTGPGQGLSYGTTIAMGTGPASVRNAIIPGPAGLYDYNTNFAYTGSIQLEAGTYTFSILWRGGSQYIQLSRASLIVDAIYK
jgi:hypothetical protein